MRIYRETHKEERRLYDEAHKEKIQEQQLQLIDENREHVNKLKRANYHKNKKPPTEEQLQVKKLRIKEQMEKMRAKAKENRERDRLLNPMTDEERKERMLKMNRINNVNYIKRKKGKKQSMMNETI